MNGDGSTKPSWWYALIGLAIMLSGGVLFVYFLWSGLSHLTDSLTQVVVPGQANLALTTPGTYVVFLEEQSVVNGQIYSTSESVAGLACAVKSEASDQTIPIRKAKVSMTYSMGGRSGRSVLEFDVTRAGSYLFSCDYPPDSKGPQVVVAVGAGFGQRLTFTVISSLASLFGGLLFGGLAIFAVYRMRSRAQNMPSLSRESYPR